MGDIYGCTSGSLPFLLEFTYTGTHDGIGVLINKRRCIPELFALLFHV